MTGHDIGVYAQTAYSPTEWFELRAGLRYDAHNAPFAGTATQVSPRVRLNFYPSTSTTLYLYYGRQFIPTNIEDLRAVTRAAQGGDVNRGTVPERDNFFEAGAIGASGTWGIVAKLSAYDKRSNPGIDDNTVPGSAIVTDVNIEHVHITGIEAVLETGRTPPGLGTSTRPSTTRTAPARSRAVSSRTPPVVARFDLDHDQRLSLVGSATYRWVASM